MFTQFNVKNKSSRHRFLKSIPSLASDLITCSVYSCNLLDSRCEMVCCHLFLNSRLMHLYWKASSFFASVFVGFQASQQHIDQNCSYNRSEQLNFVFLLISLVSKFLETREKSFWPYLISTVYFKSLNLRTARPGEKKKRFFTSSTCSLFPFPPWSFLVFIHTIFNF